jgi:predicted dehydrogenase
MKVGIIGLGRAGKRHATHAADLGNDVLWTDPIAFDIAPRSSGRYHTAEEVMDLADAVVVATPTSSHAKYLHEAVVRRKPVLVEKPIGSLGSSTLIADSLMAADNDRIPVATGFNLRFHPLTAILKELQHPYYGSFICAQYTDNIADGVLNHWASHEIDLARYLFGNLRVLDRYVQNSRAADLYLINWTTNARVHLHSDMIARDHMRLTTLIAMDGWVHSDYERQPVEEVHYKDMLNAFLNWAKDGSQSSRLATGWDGYDVLRICEKASALNVQRDP